MLNDMSPAILALLASALTAIAMLLLMQRRIASLQERLTLAQTQHHSELTRARDEADARIAQHRADNESEFKLKLEEARDHQLAVTVHPFVRTTKNDGWFAKESQSEIGYKYQLMMRGIPCFASHDVVIESSTHKELNQQTMALLQQKAEQLAGVAFAAKAGPAAPIVHMAKTAISSLPKKT